MKATRMKFLSLSAFLVVLVPGYAAFGEEVGEVKQWVGSGTSYDFSLNELRQYNLKLTSTAINENQSRTVTVATSLDGDVLRTTECLVTQTDAGQRFIDCDNGRGVGAVIDKMSTRRLFKFDGTVTVTGTRISEDGLSRETIRTEIENGFATRYFRENLERVFDVESEE